MSAIAIVLRKLPPGAARHCDGCGGVPGTQVILSRIHNDQPAQTVIDLCGSCRAKLADRLRAKKAAR